MKSYNEISKDKEEYINKRDTLLDVKIGVMEGLLYAALTKFLLSLATDKDGKLKNSTAEIKKAERKLQVLFVTFSVAVRTGFASWVIKSLKGVFGFNKRYFKAVKKIPETVEEKALRELLRGYGYDIDKEQIVKGGWLDGLTGHDTVKNRVLKEVVDAMKTGTSLKDFQKQFEGTFLGKNGHIKNHYKVFSQGFFIQNDRAIQYHLGRKAGLDHWLFSGTAIENTRDFCLERLNNIYTTGFIEEWEDLKWAGKIENTRIWISLGGYNCRHHLRAISRSMAKLLQRKGKLIDEYNEIEEKKVA